MNGGAPDLRACRAIKRLVILGHSGIISLEALRWLHNTEAAFVQIDNDSELIIAAGTSSLNDARLRRAQALASSNKIGLEIGRELLREKLKGQANVLKRLSTPTRTFFSIPGLIKELSDNESADDLRRTEAQAAIIYWSAWSDIPVKFEPKDVKRVPDHWFTFGQR
jgi:CRISPR/Cas system-associated endonuclease Cas1